MTVEQRDSLNKSIEPVDSQRIIRVDAGITEHKPDKLTVNPQRRSFLSRILPQKNQGKTIPETSYWYRQTDEARQAVIAAVNPTVLDREAYYEGDGGKDIKQLPKGTRVTLGVSYSDSVDELRETRLLVLGGVILDSDTFVDGWGGNHHTQSGFWEFRLASQDKPHLKHEEEIKNAQTFMSKYPELLDQDAIKLDLNRITEITLILGINEIVRGRFDNLSEYRAWWDQNIDKAWDTVCNLRERLETAGVLEKDEENPDMLKYRQRHSDAYGESYEASFSDNHCRIEVFSEVPYASRRDDFTIYKGRAISAGVVSFLSSTAYGAYAGSRGGSVGLDRDGIIRYDKKRQPSDPSQSVDIYSSVTMFEEFDQMCEKIGKSTQSADHPSA